MSSEKKEPHSGLAALFDRVELKSFFINYLWFIIAVEILIFLVSFLGNLGPEKGPFPWKFYFYVSFVTPVAITFLLGVFILAFNQFIFGSAPVTGEDRGEGEESEDSRSKLFQFNLFLTHMKKVPFLPMLFALVACTVLFYKLDAIFLFIFNAGEKMVTYSLIACGVLLVAGLLFGIAWIVSNYKLSQKHMEHEYRYRNNVMDKLGFLIMEDDTVIDKNGKLISQKQLLPADTQPPAPERESLKILPPSK
ncbi:MAG: hypothetical protein CR984_05170 [Proteobacteria bacterium]|nr:MAG: hypothetical protein CR984_05170 [Pseudomonadota bacterium]PIE67525.1 MAG: hypothetical protein CSA23_03610 [Deltaproteobacteria bacterium]